MAVLDTAHKDLYVACTGDSRAVAGVWEQTGPDGEGVWKVEVLSQDQTGRNPDEAKRLASSSCWIKSLYDILFSARRTGSSPNILKMRQIM